MPRVLIVDADPFARELRSQLIAAGCAVDIVTDGRVGVDAAARTRPDVILLSADLPHVNGFSLCNKLKREPALAMIPVLLISSLTSYEAIEQHSQLPTRADDYLPRPITAAEVVARIRQR